MKVVFLILCLSVLCFSQKSPKSKEPKRPPEIENLVNESFFLPEEFGSNLLNKIAESNLIKDIKWKKEILEKSLTLSNNAQQPVKKKLAIFGISTDNREVFISNANELNLDKMSLQLSIVRQFLKIDKFRARQIFEFIENDNSLLKTSCENALFADVSDYYDTVAEIANSFDNKEKQANIHYNFVNQFVTQSTSNIQIVPIIKMIKSLKFTNQEKINLTISFLNSLKTIDFESRSFDVMLNKQRAVENFNELKVLLPQESQDFLTISLRNLLISNLKNQPCKDYSLSRKEVSRYIEFFNKTFISNSPISMEELDVNDFNESLVVGLNDTLLSQNANELRNRYKGLRFIENGEDYREISETEKAEITWQNKVADFLSELEKWNGNQENSELDFFIQKCIFYKTLVQILPKNSSLEQKILQSYVTFIGKSNLYKTEKTQWFYWASDFFKQKNDTKIDFDSNATFRVYRKFYAYTKSSS
jgi:hypothetical protein